MATRILITDSEHSVALAATRSLGRAGYDVLVCGSERLAYAALSRHASRHFVVPNPLLHRGRYAEAVRALCAEQGVEVLLPMTDASLLALLPIRDSIAARFPWPSLATFERASEKAIVRELGAELGIAVPKQQVVTSSAELGFLDPSLLRFPVVIKPGRSIRGESEHEVMHAANTTQLRHRLESASPNAYPLLIQERIVGPGTGIFLLRWQGKTRAHFAHKRLRERPPSGGASVYSEAIIPDPTLLAQSERLLERLDWEGVAMVEYKVDSRTGTPYLMEMNGRFWGSLQLAVDAGVDFPLMLVRLALGEEIGPPPKYRAGTKLRSIWRDVEHLMARVRWSPADLDLPADAPSRTRVVLDFLKWRRGDRFEIMRLSDPMPGAKAIINFIRRRT